MENVCALEFIQKQQCLFMGKNDLFFVCKIPFYSYTLNIAMPVLPVTSIFPNDFCPS